MQVQIFYRVQDIRRQIRELNGRVSKVLFLGPDTEISERYKGGIHHILKPLKENYIQEFYRNGVELCFFNTERFSRSADSGGKINLNNVLHALKIYRDCSRELMNNNYDVILYASSTGVPLLKDLFIARLLKQKHKVRVVFQIHYANIDSILLKKYHFESFVLRQMILVCDGCIFLSSNLLSQFVAKGFPKNRTHLLYNYHKMQLSNGVIESKISEDKSGRTTRFIFMGSFDRRKGLLDLFGALEKMDDAVYSLDLCGGYNSDDAELKEILETFCANHQHSVHNHGYVSSREKDSVFIRADVCVLPSYGEGLPVVLLEAMASGCAIITTNVGAITEIIEEGKNGIVLAPGDIEALRNALWFMINNKQQLKMMQRINYQESVKYGVETYIDRLCAILKLFSV